jgi:hypothetical protein
MPNTWVAELLNVMGKPVTKPERARKICEAVGATLLQKESTDGEWEVQVTAAINAVVMDRGYYEKPTDHGLFMIRAGGRNG